jgi:hypothetical protein
VESKTVIFSRAFNRGGPGCVVCGAPAQQRLDVRHACCSRHKHHAGKVRQQIRRGEAKRALFEGPDVCRYCGAAAPPSLRGAALCSAKCWRTFERRGFWKFKKAVKWPQPLPWLGKRIGLPGDDPRLGEIALTLANAGQLVVYVRGDGTVGEVGRPKHDRQPRRRSTA